MQTTAAPMPNPEHPDKILCALLNPHEVDLPDLAYRLGISLRSLAEVARSNHMAETIATFSSCLVRGRICLRASIMHAR